jgi:hypothetical protein
LAENIEGAVMTNDSLKKPLAREDVTVQVIGDEVMLYDNSSEKIHVLNHSAYAIWKLCDGSHTTEDIRVQLVDQYPDAETDVVDDIQLIIADFIKKSLLI